MLIVDARARVNYKTRLLVVEDEVTVLYEKVAVILNNATTKNEDRSENSKKNTWAMAGRVGTDPGSFTVDRR